MDYIEYKYLQLCKSQSDINEHLPTLKKYAEQCESVLETGVRGCVSSWALCYGLLQNKGNKYMLMNDIYPCNIEEILNSVNNIDSLNIEYKWCNNLTLDLDRDFDMVFIDTWHVYGQLKRELEKFAPRTKKWIIMHDTTIDEFTGESIREGHDIGQIMEKTGFTRDEVEKGLKYAIDDFLQSNLNWCICEKFTNNNGLTILERLF